MRLKAPIWKMMLRWRQHRALGGTRRARGVDDDRHVAGLRDARCGFPIPVALLAPLDLRPSSTRSSSDITIGSAEPAQALHVEHDDLAQARRALAHGQDLVELLLVLHEQVLGIAVVDRDTRPGPASRSGRCRSTRPRRTRRQGRRTATPCCCRRGWRRVLRAPARARSALSRRPWPPRRSRFQV